MRPLRLSMLFAVAVSTTVVTGVALLSGQQSGPAIYTADQASAGRAVYAASCAGCHMPLVKPSPELGFTNHWIGVYRLTGPGANLLRPVQQRPRR